MVYKISLYNRIYMRQTRILYYVAISIVILSVTMYYLSVSKNNNKENFESKTENIRAFYRRNHRKMKGLLNNRFSDYKNRFHRKMRRLTI